MSLKGADSTPCTGRERVVGTFQKTDDHQLGRLENWHVHRMVPGPYCPVSPLGRREGSGLS